MRFHVKVQLIGLILLIIGLCELLDAVKVFSLIDCVSSAITDLLFGNFHVLLHVVFHLAQLSILVRVVDSFD